MAQEPWRAYLELALGITEASRKQAKKTVKRLIGKSGATAEQMQLLAEDLVRIGLENRESVVRMVRTELDKALVRLGVAGGDELTELRERIKDLEERLRAYQAESETAVPKPSVPKTDGPAEAEAEAPVQTEPPVAQAQPEGQPEPVPVVKKSVARKRVAKKVAAPQVEDVPAQPQPEAQPEVQAETPAETKSENQSEVPSEAVSADGAVAQKPARARKAAPRKVAAKRAAPRKSAAQAATADQGTESSPEATTSQAAQDAPAGDQ